MLSPSWYLLTGRCAINVSLSCSHEHLTSVYFSTFALLTSPWYCDQSMFSFPQERGLDWAQTSFWCLDLLPLAWCQLVLYIISFPQGRGLDWDTFQVNHNSTGSRPHSRSPVRIRCLGSSCNMHLPQDRCLVETQGLDPYNQGGVAKCQFFTLSKTFKPILP